MTGLHNRRALLEAIKEEVTRTARTGVATSVIMIDLDDFKKINDTYGHIIGDMVLRESAKAIKTSLRVTDKVFRYGGEEFTVILPQTQLDEAIKIAERIRRAVGDCRVCSNNACVSVTASLGVATIAPSMTMLSPEAILNAADQLLLRAKRQGKNMVMWESEVAEKAHISHEERQAILALFPSLGHQN
jgi:diguanylate cyclase (GGDEF)-like protein